MSAREQVIADIEWHSAPWLGGEKGLYQVWAVYKPTHAGDLCASVLVMPDDPNLCQKLLLLQHNMVRSALRMAIRDGNFEVEPCAK
jgi:hypothetical protein